MKHFYILISIIIIILTQYSFIYCKSGYDHISDMARVILGDNKYNTPETRDILYKFTKTIDNFEIIKDLPLGPSGHRIYGHWGYSDSIPFSKTPLKDMLERISFREGDEAALIVKNKIINAWINDTKTLYILSSKLLRIDGQPAKGLAGILYDIHLLGDYSGSKLQALQNIEELKNDINKNIHRLFGNNSKNAKEITNSIDKVFKQSYIKSNANQQLIANDLLEYISNSKQINNSLKNLAISRNISNGFVNTPLLHKIQRTDSLPSIQKQIDQLGLKNAKVLPALINGNKMLIAIENGAATSLEAVFTNVLVMYKKQQF